MTSLSFPGWLPTVLNGLVRLGEEEVEQWPLSIFSSSSKIEESFAGIKRLAPMCTWDLEQLLATHPILSQFIPEPGGFPPPTLQ